MKSLYVITAPDGKVKVGVSSNPEQRCRALGRNLSVAHATELVGEPYRIEALAHRVLALTCRQVHDEWFEATVDEAVQAINTAIDQANGNQLALGGTTLQSVRRRKQDRKTNPMAFRIDADIKAKLERLAAADNRTLTNFIETQLERMVAQADQDKHP